MHRPQAQLDMKIFDMKDLLNPLSICTDSHSIASVNKGIQTIN